MRRSHAVHTCKNVQVICWELLTKSKFYGARASTEDVVAALEGHTQVASERDSMNSCTHLGTGTFRQSILSMLSRDKSKRPKVKELLAIWDSCYPQPGHTEYRIATEPFEMTE
jgi:hypothetical protein